MMALTAIFCGFQISKTMGLRTMKQVRIGIVGVGNIGTLHTRNLLGDKIKHARLAAIADINPAKLEPYASNESIKKYNTGQELIDSGEVDAVMVCTPHYNHTITGADALKAGLHVLVEKPISVHKADAQRLIAAHTNKKQVFAAMFNQRTTPQYQKAKQLIADGELGKLTRMNWIITDWFRSDFYYARGDWRATWSGEGGGVLLNQCPHQLDLLQWIFGMPVRVRGFCNFGKYHDIEVEDEVTAYLEFENGATGVFITSTGEAPGTNRLEICGERGKVIIEKNEMRWTRNEIETSTFRRTSQQPFAKPPVWNVEIPSGKEGGQHAEVLQNFVDAILDGKKLIAPAEEGIRSVELANSMLMSSLLGQVVEVPLDEKKFERMLKKLIKESETKPKASSNGKRAKSSAVADLSDSFA